MIAQHLMAGRGVRPGPIEDFMFSTTEPVDEDLSEEMDEDAIVRNLRYAWGG